MKNHLTVEKLREQIFEAISFTKSLSNAKPETVKGVELRKACLEAATTHGVNINLLNNFASMTIEAKDGGLMPIAKKVEEYFKNNSLRIQLLYVYENLDMGEKTKIEESSMDSINKILGTPDSLLESKIASEGIENFKFLPSLNAIVEGCRKNILQTRTNVNENVKVEYPVVLTVVDENTGTSFMRVENTILAVSKDGNVYEAAQAPQEFINLTNALAAFAEYKIDENRFNVTVGSRTFSVNNKGIFEGRTKFQRSRFAKVVSEMGIQAQEAGDLVLYIEKNFSNFVQMSECVLVTNDYGDKVLVGQIGESKVVASLKGRYPVSFASFTTIKEAVQVAEQISEMPIEEGFFKKAILKEERYAKLVENKMNLEKTEYNALLEKKGEINDALDGVDEGTAKYKRLVKALYDLEDVLEEKRKIVDGEVSLVVEEDEVEDEDEKEEDDVEGDEDEKEEEGEVNERKKRTTRKRSARSLKEAKGGVELPDTNMLLMGGSRDRSGNSTVKIKFFNGKSAFSIQTNSPEFRNTYNLLKSYKPSELSDADLAKVAKEVASYVKQFGSKKQKSGLKTWGSLKEAKTADELKAEIEKLEAQVIRVQDTKYGTEEGRKSINALNKKIGKLEDELKAMSESNYNPTGDILKSIGRKNIKSFRLHAKLKNGDVGISPWYTDEVFPEYRKEVESTGAVVIRVEMEQNGKITTIFKEGSEKRTGRKRTTRKRSARSLKEKRNRSGKKKVRTGRSRKVSEARRLTVGLGTGIDVTVEDDGSIIVSDSGKGIRIITKKGVQKFVQTLKKASDVMDSKSTRRMTVGLGTGIDVNVESDGSIIVSNDGVKMRIISKKGVQKLIKTLTKANGMMEGNNFKSLRGDMDMIISELTALAFFIIDGDGSMEKIVQNLDDLGVSMGLQNRVIAWAEKRKGKSLDVSRVRNGIEKIVDKFGADGHTVVIGETRVDLPQFNIAKTGKYHKHFNKLAQNANFNNVMLQTYFILKNIGHEGKVYNYLKYGANGKPYASGTVSYTGKVKNYHKINLDGRTIKVQINLDRESQSLSDMGIDLSPTGTDDIFFDPLLNEGLDEEYDKIFKALMKKHGIKSLGELDDAKTKKFFDELKKYYKKGKGITDAGDKFLKG